ncbi:hypothetical protein ACGFYM_43720 [Streptomyces sp. NPDC048231]|uniref:hypothetical protein n=1 Tax=unclassified Streptomyces TaxID=2593676 RepID=UPI0033B80FDA
MRAFELTLAVDPARRHIDLPLIDTAPHPVIGSGGRRIQPRRQEVFEDLGVFDKIAVSGRACPRGRLHTDDAPAERTAVMMPAPTPHAIALHSVR